MHVKKVLITGIANYTYLISIFSPQGRNDLMAIGLNSFEVLHLGTYFPELLANYVKVANTLEADTNFTRHLQKEAADPIGS